MIPAAARRSRERRLAELGVAGLTALFGIVIVAGSLEHTIGWGEEGPGSGYFPFYVGLLIVGSSLGTMAMQLIRPPVADTPIVTRAGLRRVLAIFVPTVLCAAAMPWLGLYVPAIVYIAVTMRVQGRYGWPFALLVGAGVMACCFVLFEWWFQVPLAKGPVEALLGLD